MTWALLAAALAMTPARAADAPVLPDMAVGHSTPGWSKQGKSLVLYDAAGELSFEIGLLREDTGSVTREVTGGVSPDGRAAWTLERKLTWNSARSKLLESRRVLRVHGSTGQTVWSDDAVDLPEKGEPVVFSEDSKVILLACHFGESWSMEARDWAGGTTLKAGPFPRLVSIALTPGGRYAVARWGVPDKSDTHSFFDLWTKARKDIETSDLTLGLARIGDDGVVRSGRRDVFSFSTAKSTATEGAAK
ncbi:MAG: hypothetical protein HYV14_09345 [Elusimicrobia bacterium]|nr:hypothetical protein [Elusimicrobiota bacterium]